MIATAISIIAGICTTVIGALILAKVNKGQVAEEKREEDREHRENLTLESLDATFSICRELTRCVRGEKPNGELTEAFDYLMDVKSRVNAYQRERASRR